MRRIASLVLVVTGLLVVSVGPVSAAKPGTPPPTVVKGVNQHTNYVDDVFCHYGPYAFDLVVDGTDTYTITTSYNADSSISKIVFEDHFDGTVSANGKTLRKEASGHTIYDFNGGTDTFDGLEAKYSPVGGGKPIAMDTGVIVFDAGGNIVRESGQHPIAHGPGVLAVCAALS